MKIAVVGAGGFVGKNLIAYLLKDGHYSVNAVTLNPNKIKIKNDRLKVFCCDIFDLEKLEKALKNCETAIYLVHLMGKDKDWFNKEAEAADIFCRAAKNSKTKKVIYLGGLGDDSKPLSKHLKSRHKTGKIFFENLPVVIELRASVIIGKGSASFDLVDIAAKRFSIIFLPTWASTKIQPISIDDVIQYVVSSINRKFYSSEIIEIGGPEVMTYKQFLLKRARYLKKKLYVVKIGLLPKWPLKYLINVFNSKTDTSIAKEMISSLNCDMVVKNDRAKKLFEDIKPQTVEQAFDRV